MKMTMENTEQAENKYVESQDVLEKLRATACYAWLIRKEPPKCGQNVSSQLGRCSHRVGRGYNENGVGKCISRRARQGVGPRSWTWSLGSQKGNPPSSSADSFAKDSAVWESVVLESTTWDSRKKRAPLTSCVDGNCEQKVGGAFKNHFTKKNDSPLFDSDEQAGGQCFCPRV